MNNETFNFELLDKDVPEVVIENSLKQIEEVTRGYVIGNVGSYGGAITSYTKKTGLSASLATLQIQGETVEVDIQDILGEQHDKKNRYEVFLTVKGLEHYKYRMMFIDYGAISYPVTVVMNENLAIEFSGKINERFLIQSMKELEEMMDVIINSNTMVSLIQKLINEALRQEAKPISESAEEME